MKEIELNDDDLNAIYQVTIEAFKSDTKNKTEIGLESIVNKIDGFWGCGLAYQQAKQDYKDTHISGLGKGAYGAGKTATAMAARSVGVILGAVTKLTGLGIYCLGRASRFLRNIVTTPLDGGNETPNYTEIAGILISAAGGLGVAYVAEKNMPMGRMMDDIAQVLQKMPAVQISEADKISTDQINLQYKKRFNSSKLFTI